MIPSHSQVSPPPIVPPKRTVTPRSASYAFACPALGDGPLTIRWVQAVPSHSQVSPLRPAEVEPPKRTVTPRAVSQAIAWMYRGEGPLLARWLHAIPFHSQVSPIDVPNGLPMAPPKSTVTPRAE